MTIDEIISTADAYAMKAFPQIRLREYKGLAHAELLMMFPERCHQEVMRFWNGDS